MPKVDLRFGNSSGYFKDPVSEEDFSPDTERIVKADLINGKFIWPQVAVSDGSMLVKIVYKCFTEEEKQLYKKYRGRDNGRSNGTVSADSNDSRTCERKQSEERLTSVISDDSDGSCAEPSTVKHTADVVHFDEDSAMSFSTATMLKNAELLLGITYMAGITYAILQVAGVKGSVHVPRKVIPDDMFERLQELSRQFIERKRR